MVWSSNFEFLHSLRQQKLNTQTYILLFYIHLTAIVIVTVAPIEKECCRILEIWITNRIKRQQQNVQIVWQLRKLNYVFRILNWTFRLVHIVHKVPNKFISTCLTNVLQNVHSIQIRCLSWIKKNNLNDINHRAIHYKFHNISLERKKDYY